VSRNVYRFVGVAAAALALLVVAGTAGATSQRAAATKVNICYANAATDFTPAFVAQNEGFFAKNGLDVNLVLASGGRGAQFLASGVCDINLDSATPDITADQRGADFVLLGADANTFDFRLVAKASIANVKALAGKTLALSSPGAAVDIAGRAMLKEFSLNASAVNIVYISSLAARLAALQSGSIDAMIISPPIGKVIGDGTKYKMIYNLKGLHFILNGTWTTRRYAQANPDVIKAYLRSDVQALQFLKNPAKKAAVLKDVAAVTGFTDPSDTEEAYNDVLKFQQPEPLIDNRALRNSIQWVNAQLNVNIDQNSFLYLSPLQQVLTRHLSAKLTAAQSVPKPKGAKGTGSFSATLTPAGKLSWKLSAAGLTGKPIYAGIHIGRPGKSAPAVLQLCAPCKTGASGSAKAYTPLQVAIKQGNAFVTVATAKNTKGEIRGQITATLG
jgi:NitT/TauT family transport system substrate-binding protein